MGWLCRAVRDATVRSGCELSTPKIDMIEINTAKYAEGDLHDIERIRTASQEAERLGLTVAAGHGLTHHNLGLLVREVPEIVEYNIGHSIVSRSIFVGWEAAIKDILTIIDS